MIWEIVSYAEARTTLEWNAFSESPFVTHPIRENWENTASKCFQTWAGRFYMPAEGCFYFTVALTPVSNRLLINKSCSGWEDMGNKWLLTNWDFFSTRKFRVPTLVHIWISLCPLYQKQVRKPKPRTLGSVVKIEVGAENIHKRAWAFDAGGLQTWP